MTQELNLDMNQPKHKILRDAIGLGGMTDDRLMEILKVDKKGLASQISSVRMIAEDQPKKAICPMKGEDGVWGMVLYSAFADSKSASGSKAAPKVMTVEQVKAKAQKREDAASKKYSTWSEKDQSVPFNAAKAEVAKAELHLASVMLAAVENGDYQYENVTIGEPAAEEQAPSGEGLL